MQKIPKAYVFGIFSVVISIEEMCYLAVFLVGNYRIEINVLDAAEYICLYLRVALFQLSDKMLDLKPL